MGLLTVCLLFLRSSAAPASAQSTKAIMEGVTSSSGTILISTRTGRVNIGTNTYSGSVPLVALHVGSNVVIDSISRKDACVIYATGSITCLGATFSTGTVVTNASMVGDGTPTAPLGVLSSSYTSRALFDGFISTAGPRISAHDAWMSTASVAMESLRLTTETYRLWQSTITPRIAAHDAWMSTASVALESLRVTTETFRLWESTASTRLADYDTFLSTANNFFRDIRVTTAAIGVSTASLNTLKLASPTASGTVGQVVSLGSDGTPTWATAGSGSASTMTVSFQTDNFISAINGTTKIFTLSATPQSSSAVWVVMDGQLQSGTSDYVISGPVVTMTTAPAGNSSSFYVQYAVNTSTLPGVGILIATQTWSGINTYTSASSFTAGSTITLAMVQSYAASTYTFTNSANFSGGFGVVVASYPSEGSQGITFSGFRSSITYHCSAVITNQSATSHPMLVINGDRGTNYGWDYNGFVRGVGAWSGDGSGKTACEIMDSAGTAQAVGTHFLLEFTISTMPRNSKRVQVSWNYTGDRATDAYNNGACWYTGASDFANLRLQPGNSTTATYVGEFVCQAKGR